MGLEEEGGKEPALKKVCPVGRGQRTLNSHLQLG